MVPDLGCNNNQVHIATEHIGRIDPDISLSIKPMDSRQQFNFNE